MSTDQPGLKTLVKKTTSNLFIGTVTAAAMAVGGYYLYTQVSKKSLIIQKITFNPFVNPGALIIEASPRGGLLSWLIGGTSKKSDIVSYPITLANLKTTVEGGVEETLVKLSNKTFIATSDSSIITSTSTGSGSGSDKGNILFVVYPSPNQRLALTGTTSVRNLKYDQELDIVGNVLLG